jgi:Ca2+-transporting ATPase
LLELVIDPACAIAFENEAADPDVMQRPPRDIQAPLFGWHDMALALAQGLCVLSVVGLGQWWASGRLDEASTRALLFATLVVANGGLILATRASARQAQPRRPRNTVLVWILGLNLLVLVLALNTPWALAALHFAPLPAQAWAVALALGVLSGWMASTLRRATRDWPGSSA